MKKLKFDVQIRVFNGGLRFGEGELCSTDGKNNDSKATPSPWMSVLTGERYTNEALFSEMVDTVEKAEHIVEEIKKSIESKSDEWFYYICHSEEVWDDSDKFNLDQPAFAQLRIVAHDVTTYVIGNKGTFSSDRFIQPHEYDQYEIKEGVNVD